MPVVLNCILHFYEDMKQNKVKTMKGVNLDSSVVTFRKTDLLSKLFINWLSGGRNKHFPLIVYPNRSNLQEATQVTKLQILSTLQRMGDAFVLHVCHDTTHLGLLCIQYGRYLKVDALKYNSIFCRKNVNG